MASMSEKGFVVCGVSWCRRHCHPARPAAQNVENSTSNNLRRKILNPHRKPELLYYCHTLKSEKTIEHAEAGPT